MSVSSLTLVDTGFPLLEARLRFMLSEEPRVLSASEHIGEMLGFTPAEFLSSRVSFRDRIHPDDNDIAEMLFGPDFRDEPMSCNIRLRCADGQILCVRADFTKRRDHGSGTVVIDLCLQDAKSLNRLSNGQFLMANFKAMMENTDDIIFFKDRHHVYTAASRSLQEAVRPILGGASLIGLTDYDFLPEAEADAFYRPEKKVFAGADVARELQKVVLPNGETRWMDDWKYPIKDESGEILGLFAIARDITERVQVEQTLRESEEALRESQRIAGIGSYVSDLRTFEWTCSDVLDALFGIERKAEHEITEWEEILHPQDRDRIMSYFRDEVIAARKPFDKEYRIMRRSDGAIRWMHGLGRLDFDAGGRPILMYGTIQDITERKLAEAALRESKELLQLFVEHAPAALAMYDREMRVLAISRRWVEDYGVKEHDIVGRSHYELVPDLPEPWKNEHLRVLAGESLHRDEDRFERADGTVQWLRRELIPWRLANGDVGGIVILSEDITRAKQAEDRLRLSASVFTNASEAIVITALDGAILEINDTFTRITGYTRDEVLGRNLRILKSGRQDKEFYDTMWQSVLIDGHWSGEIWNRAKSGDLFAALETITTVFDAGGVPQHYVALMTDITPIKEQERKLQHIAHYDALTGLPNRALLAESLRYAMVQSQPDQVLAVVSFDLDCFKAVNDRYGREAGDALLAAVAYRMRKVFRDSDTLARTGGDEFVAVLRHLENPDAAVTAVNRLLRCVAEPQTGDLMLRVSASAGVTLYPQAEDVDADQLLRQADRAMYRAKLDGKDRVHFFDPTEDRTARGHLEDVENLRRALAACEFVLHYQPKVNMASGKLVGAEALIRWQHPRRGLLGPQSFLPAIEDHPLAVEIGEWVIDTALEQMESWRAMGLNISVSVNVGARQLQEPSFIERLSALLAAHPGIEPACLEIEVLETSALMDVALVSSHIEECRRLGVSVAIDDFGTGYSSLTYLKRLPANVLKIDQSFIREMLNDPEDLAILEGVLGLASAFRRQAIAEGVETVEHGVMLLQMGCELAQGYGIARPMPADELPAWVAAWKPDPRWAVTQAISPADWPILYAGVEHRAWLKLLDAYLRGERSAPPTMDARHCRLGTWLLSEAKGPRGAQAAFQQIEPLHLRVHELAAEAIALKAEGRAEAQARLPELQPLLEEVLNRVEALAMKC